MPTIVISGLAGKTVNEARDRLRGAFMSSRLELPRRRITINLAPADIPKADSGLDLAIAASILVASQQVMALNGQTAIIGELGLDGQIRPVRGIIGKLLAGRKRGITTYYIPAANMDQARLVPGLTVYGVASLRELYDHLAAKRLLEATRTSNTVPLAAPSQFATTFDDVIGHDAAKRLLTVAAAGGHNVLLSGPPGTGKSLLARALPAILPPLNHEEMLQVTQLHSLTSHNYEQLLTERPVRSPHHTASLSAMVGGGSNLRPGEISLSHRGVLFLDELPEFNRQTLEALRQPLEDRCISVARARDSVQFPANFILIATTNPCPCGYYGVEGKHCSCQQYQIEHYQHKLSGPIFDRIDLTCTVTDTDHDQLLSTLLPPISSRTLQTQVQAARQRQAQRYDSDTKLNSDLTSREIIHHAHLSRAARTTLNQAADTLGLSTRAYFRIVKVSQTIADLAEAKTITEEHIAEAISYRQYSPQQQPV